MGLKKIVFFAVNANWSARLVAGKVEAKVARGKTTFGISRATG
jgi:hypothetical protein